MAWGIAVVWPVVAAGQGAGVYEAGTGSTGSTAAAIGVENVERVERAITEWSVGTWEGQMDDGGRDDDRERLPSDPKVVLGKDTQKKLAEVSGGERSAVFEMRTFPVLDPGEGGGAVRYGARVWIRSGEAGKVGFFLPLPEAGGGEVSLWVNGKPVERLKGGEIMLRAGWNQLVASIDVRGTPYRLEATLIGEPAVLDRLRITADPPNDAATRVLKSNGEDDANDGVVDDVEGVVDGAEGVVDDVEGVVDDVEGKVDGAEGKVDGVVAEVPSRTQNADQGGYISQVRRMDAPTFVPPVALVFELAEHDDRGGESVRNMGVGRGGAERLESGEWVARAPTATDPERSLADMALMDAVMEVENPETRVGSVIGPITELPVVEDASVSEATEVEIGAERDDKRKRLRRRGRRLFWR